MSSATFSVTILGSSSAKPTLERFHSSQVINYCEQLYVVDVGEGAQRQMMQYGVNMQKIRAIFISHLHGDHCYGLFPLLSTMALYGRKTPIDIYAPAPMGEIIESHLRLYGVDIPYPLNYHRVDTTKHQLLFENRTLEVWSIPLRHRIPTSGYLFREKPIGLNINKYCIDKYNLSIAQIAAAKRGEDITLDSGECIENGELTYTPRAPRSYAYISDTIFSAKAAKLCQGVDLMYHESTYMDVERNTARARGHSTTIEAAKCATQAEAKSLIIGHFSARYRDLQPLIDEARTLFAATELAEPGRVFNIAPSASSC